MAGLVTQLKTVEAGNDILTRATRLSSQFSNGASSLIAELAAFEAGLPAAGLDAETTAEIATLKAQTIAQIQSQLTAIQTALSQA